MIDLAASETTPGKVTMQELGTLPHREIFFTSTCNRLCFLIKRERITFSTELYALIFELTGLSIFCHNSLEFLLQFSLLLQNSTIL